MRRSYRHCRTVLALVATLVVMSVGGAVRAETATALGYGGRLTDASGTPVSGTVDLSVGFFAAKAGGSPLLGAPLEFRGTELTQGVFQLTLALSAAQMDAVFGDGTQAVWVELKDATHGKTYPRQRFLMVPYAARVPVDGTSVVYDGSGRLSVGAVDAAKVTGLAAMLADMGDAAKLQGVPLGTGTPAAGAVLKYVGGQWQAVAGDSVAGNFGIGTTSAQTALDVAGVLTQRGAAAPGVAPAGEGRIYFDTTSNQFMVSQNGGAYAPLGTVTGGVITQVSAGGGLTGGGTTGNVTVAMPSVGTAGTYTRVLTDAYGRVTAGGTLTAADLPTIPAGMISGALPVTQLAGTLAAAQLPSLSAAEVTSGTLAVALGGTGVTSFPSGGVVVGAGSLPLSTVSAGSQYQLLLQGASGPAFGPVELGQSAAVSGTLAVAHLPPIPAGLVTGSLAAAQISGTLAASQVGTIPVSQITGTLAAAQVAAIPVSQLSGTLTAAQVGTIPVTQLSGTFAAAQLPGIPATSITGTLGAAQISGTLATALLPSIPASLVTGSLGAAQISGTLAASQIASIPTTQITGTLAAAQVAAIPASQVTGAFPTLALSSPGGGSLLKTGTGGTLAAATAADLTSLIGGSAYVNKAGDTMSGSLGIGTATAARTLHVASPSNLPLRVERTGLNYVDVGLTGPLVGGDASDVYLQTGTLASSGYILNTYTGTVGVNALAIDNTGRVGIGSLSPATKLDVFGAVKTLGLTGPSITTAETPASAATNGGDGAYQTRFVTNVANYIPGANYGSITGYVNSSNASGYTYQQAVDAAGNYYFRTAQDASNWRPWAFTIRNNGSVGIGSLTPAKTLDVVGNFVLGSGAERMSLTGAGNVSALGFNRNVDTGVIYNSGGSAYQLTHFGNSLATADVLKMEVYTGGGTSVNGYAMMWNGLGYVGISTASPTSPLTVGGTIQSTTGGVKFPDATVQQSAFVDPGLDGGRLTLTSGAGVTTTDVTGAAAATLYFTPFRHNRLALWNGTYWQAYTFSQLSLSLSGIGASQTFDVFVYDNAGTLTLEAVNWTNDTTRATALTTQDGVYVKTGATTHRYLGTARTTTVAGQSEDSALRRFVWNVANRVTRPLKRYEPAANWTYNSTTWRPWNNSTANRVEVVVGLDEEPVRVDFEAHMAGASGVVAYIALALDSTTTPSGMKQAANAGTSSGSFGIHTLLIRNVGIGYHYVQALEETNGAGSITFYGVSGGDVTEGLEGTVVD